MKNLSYKVVDGGGIIRSIQNHGIRTLPHRFRAAYADRAGTRYYKEGRFVSIFYDASPKILSEVENVLKMDEQVLRHTHLKAQNKMWFCNISREDKNPYIRKVLSMEKKAKLNVNNLAPE